MEQKEFNEQMEQVKKSIKEEVKAEAAKEAEGLKAEIADIKVKAEGWEKKAKDMEIEAAAAKKFGPQMTTKDAVAQAFEANKDALLKMKEDKFAPGVQMTVKAAATITTANYTGGTYNLTQADMGITEPARRSPYLRQIVHSFPLSKPYVVFTEKVNRDGGAGSTAEGAAKSLADFDWVEATKKAEKITEYMKLTKESLDDIPFQQSEVYNEIITGIALKLDGDLYSGSGTTPVIKGITGYAPTISLTGTPFLVANGGVKAANRMDVVRIAKWVVDNNYFSANYVLLNSVDAAQMDLVKDSNGQYLIPPFASADHARIAGLPVIVNNGVTAGTFLVGDFSKSNLGIREDIVLSVGYENDDFTKNLVTILGEMRAVHYIKANHVNAFVQGTFATVITAANV